MQIRTYSPDDKSHVMELFRLNTPTYFDPSEEPDLSEYLDHRIDQYYIAELDQQIVGCGGINYTDDPHIIRISWDIVHPEKHGQGIGRALLEYRIQQINEMENIKTISVRTSQLVYPFYEKFDFELMEIVKDFWAKGIDMVRMERKC